MGRGWGWGKTGGKEGLEMRLRLMEAGKANTEPLTSSVALTVSTAWLVATEAEITKQLCCKTEI